MIFKTGTAVAVLAVAATLATGAPAFAQTVSGPTGQELSWSSAAQRTGAFTTRAWASRGRGVTIAVVDSGIRADHREFQGALTNGFNAFTGATGVAAASDTNGHGTHVASIAAARVNNIGMAGVASSATILPVRVFNGPSTTDAVVARGVSWTTSQRAFVVNMSLGGPVASPAMRDAMRAGVNAGQLFVVAAGNEGQPNPAFPARFATEAWARGQIIAVGAVDANNAIASFSNRAGDARNFFLVAPGTSIIGAYHTAPNAYVAMSGTSMAAPVVAGAAAVVKGAWPHLTAQQVANVLFTTATDLGAKGTDAVFGRGLLNLTRAMQPVGPVAAVGAAGSTQLGTASTASGGATFGAMAAASASGAMDGVVFDSFGRDFGYDFAWRSSFARPSGAVLAGQGLEARMAGATTAIEAPQGRYTLREEGAGASAAQGTASLRFDGRDGSGWAVSFGDAARLTGIGAAPQDSVAVRHGGVAALAPLVQGDAASASVWRPLSTTVRFGLSATTETGSAALTSQNTGPQARSGASSVDASLSWQASSRVKIRAGLSALSEARGRLGSVEAPELAVSGAASTLASHATAVIQTGARTSLVASMTAASTAPQAGTATSLVRTVSETRTAAWSLALVQSDVLTSGDRLDLSVGTPLTAVSGAMNMRLAVGADPETGAPILEDRRVSLRSATPEQRAEIAYMAPLGSSGEIGFGMMARQNADGVKGRDEAALALRMVSRF